MNPTLGRWLGAQVPVVGTLPHRTRLPGQVVLVLGLLLLETSLTEPASGAAVRAAAVQAEENQ